ncbi:MAG: tetratricopeptide repeat protein [Blastocatellia bacterium]|nr:tetratricopeptide repeat protein [Blastocatellia bacterium]
MSFSQAPLALLYALTFLFPQNIPVPADSKPEQTNSAPAPPQTPAEQPAVASLGTVLDDHAELQRLAKAPLAERPQLLSEFLTKHAGSPILDECRILLAKTYGEQGEQALRSSQPTVARDAFLKLIEALPTPLSAAHLRAYVLPLPVLMAGYGNRTEAILLMRELQEKVGTNVELLEQVGLFYLSVEDPVDARQVFEKAVELDPTQANLHYDRGVALQINLRLDDAAAAFQKAAELDPKSRTAFAALGDLYRSNSLLKEAETWYRKQLAVTPDHQTAWGGLALTLYDLRREPEAAECLGKMLTLTPRDVRYWTQLAYVYAAHGEYAASAKVLERAKEIQPRYPWIRVVEAHLKRSAGDYADAENLLGEALEVVKFPTIYFELGKTLVLNQDFDRALEPFESFLKLSPEGEFETTLGGVLEVRGPRLSKLIENERRAAILMDDPLTSESQFQRIEQFVRFALLAKQAAQTAKPQTASPETPASAQPAEATSSSGGRRRRVTKPAITAETWTMPPPSETALGRALADFTAEKDENRALRYAFAARQLVEADTELPQAEALAQGAMLFAAQAFTQAEGSTSAEDRRKLFLLQAQTTLGWAQFKLGKRTEAVASLKEVVAAAPDGAEKRGASWKLGVALEATGQLEDALAAYRGGYDANASSAGVQRAVIEAVYQKIHGSLEGFDLK